MKDSDKETQVRASASKWMVIPTAYEGDVVDTRIGLKSSYDIQLWMNQHPFYENVTLNPIDYSDGDSDLAGIAWKHKFRDDFVEFLSTSYDPENKIKVDKFIDRLGLDQQCLDFLVYWRNYCNSTFLAYPELPKIK
jgi:hypothetical protein